MSRDVVDFTHRAVTASHLAYLHRKHWQEQLGKRLQSEGQESTLLWIEKMWFHLFSLIQRSDQNTNFQADLTRRTVEVQETFRKCLSRQWFYTSDINACFMSELFFRLDVNTVGSDIRSLCSLRSSTASALKLRKNTSSSKESFIAQPLSLGCLLRCWRGKLALN